MRRNKRTLILLAVAAATTAMASLFWPEPREIRYAVIDVPIPSEWTGKMFNKNGRWSFGLLSLGWPCALGEQGEVVWPCREAEHPGLSIWRESTGVEHLTAPVPEGFDAPPLWLPEAVNGLGHIAGTAVPKPVSSPIRIPIAVNPDHALRAALMGEVSNAFRWTPETGFTLLDEPGVSASCGLDINTKSQVVATGTVGQQKRIILWGAAGEITDLRGVDEGKVAALALNDYDQVAGALVWVTSRRGFVCRNRLDPPLEVPGKEWQAYDVNDAGQVAGVWRKDVTRPWRLFLWHENMGFRDLGTLPSDTAQLPVLQMDNGGCVLVHTIRLPGRSIAGVKITNPQFAAWLWIPEEGFRRLEKLVPAETSPFEVLDMNSRGEILISRMNVPSPRCALLRPQDPE